MRAPGSGHTRPAGGAGRRYLDQARAGLNAAGAYAATAWRIVLWWGATVFLIGFVEGVVTGVPDDPAFVPGSAFHLLMAEAAMIGAGAAVLRSVSRSHRRPARSLVSADGTFRLRRVALGTVAWSVPPGSLYLLAGGAGGRSFEWPGGEPWPWVAALALLPLHAAAEEVLFRGYLTQSLGLVVRDPVLLVGSVSLLFALTHLGATPWWMLPAQFTLGVAAGAAVLRDGRLEAAIGAHLANNLFALLLNGPAQFWCPIVSHGGAPVQPAALAVLILAVGAFKGAVFYGLTGAAGSCRSRASGLAGS